MNFSTREEKRLLFYFVLNIEIKVGINNWVVVISPLTIAILDRIAHDSYRIYIESSDPSKVLSMRGFYGLDRDSKGESSTYGIACPGWRYLPYRTLSTI